MSLSGRLGRGIRKRQSHPIALRDLRQINGFQRKLARARQCKWSDSGMLAGGWRGEEEVKEGVVEVKGKAGSPGCDGDGGRGAFDSQVQCTQRGWTGLIYRRTCFAVFYSIIWIYFTLLGLNYPYKLWHRTCVQLFCMRFPASFAAYVTWSRGHLQGRSEVCSEQLDGCFEVILRD